MLMVDASGLPIAVHTESARPAEVTLVHDTLEASFGLDFPERLIGDKAYDSDPLDAELAEVGIEMIAPNRRNRKRKTQDGRPLRRYKAAVDGGADHRLADVLPTGADARRVQSSELPRFRSPRLYPHPPSPISRMTSSVVQLLNLVAIPTGRHQQPDLAGYCHSRTQSLLHVLNMTFALSATPYTAYRSFTMEQTVRSGQGSADRAYRALIPVCLPEAARFPQG